MAVGMACLKEIPNPVAPISGLRTTPSERAKANAFRKCGVDQVGVILYQISAGTTRHKSVVIEVK
jgi:hypothetical protein